MFRVISHNALLVAGCLLAGSCFGQNISCPETVRVASATLESSDVPAGHKVIVSKSPVRLTGINAFNGPPEDGAVLVPKSERSSRSASTATWKFEGDYPQGKFVSCDYAQGLIRVAARLEDTVSTCTGSTRPTKPYNTLGASFHCR